MVKPTKNWNLCFKVAKIEGRFRFNPIKDGRNNPQRLNQLYNMSQQVQRVLYKVCTKCTGFVKGHLSPPPNVYLKEFKKKF